MTTVPATGHDRDIRADELDRLAINTLRFVAADGIECANSGHPGLPLGASAIAWTLWSRHLRHDPADPLWPDRDRFVLSAGHGSMLLYALLHVFGYDLPVGDLRRFRQLGSRTPGHPEYGHTPGVETTTGPLGQGIGNAVGMALAERMLAARCNTQRHRVVDHRIWVLAGDGDLMEGISHEAASLAGRLALDNLVVIFDDNDITIDGPASQSCGDDAAARFTAYGWRVLTVEDGNDVPALDDAFTAATQSDGRPVFIRVRTTIGFGAPGVAGTPKAHGSPLGADILAAMRAAFDWPDVAVHVPAAGRAAAAVTAATGAAARDRWMRTHTVWQAENPARAADYPLDGIPPPPNTDILADLMRGLEEGAAAATRTASGVALQALSQNYPALIGGSADLAASTNTAIAGGGDVRAGDYSGRTVHFGIREHAMAAVLNGLALHGGLRPFGSTFLVFADYLRPALRLSALMALPVIYIFTHDSVYVGEDGPTHQPVEQLESLRLIPGLTVLRPADSAETYKAWQLAAENLSGPTVLILSRQELPALDTAGLGDIDRVGARIVRAEAKPVVTLAASGSEVGLALAAADMLAERSVSATVLSVPCRERLEQALREGAYTLPATPVVWVEAGVRIGWRALARPGDAVIGIDRFGASGPGREVATHLGLTATAVADAALETLDR